MAATNTKEWLAFFLVSGIPRAAATQYAMTFAENRIAMNMLADLNKEYLKDLGVKALGDIIAILRHANEVQVRLAKDHDIAINDQDIDTNINVEPPGTPLKASSSSSRTVITTAEPLQTSARILEKNLLTRRQPVPQLTPVDANPGVNRRRLGPPPEIPFVVSHQQVSSSTNVKIKRPSPPDQSQSQSHSQSQSQSQGVVASVSSSSSNSCSAASKIISTIPAVFSRLASTESPKDLDDSRKRSAFARLGVSSSTSSTFSTILASNQISDNEKSRTVIRLDRPGLPQSTSTSRTERHNHLGHQHEHEQQVPAKRKTYVLVTTCPDGTKTKEILSPDDPRLRDSLEKGKVVRLRKTVAPDFAPRDQDGRRRHPDQQPLPARRDDLKLYSVKSAEPRFKRISPPRDEDVVLPVERKRLSAPKMSGSYTEQKPARKRICYDLKDQDEVNQDNHHHHHQHSSGFDSSSSLGSRLGPIRPSNLGSSSLPPWASSSYPKKTI